MNNLHYFQLASASGIWTFLIMCGLFILFIGMSVIAVWYPALLPYRKQVAQALCAVLLLNRPTPG